MKIYVAHSSNGNFVDDIYNPIINSVLNEKYNFVFPHITTDEQFESKEFFKNDCDLVIAEISSPSIGLGIELGWADIYNIPIICIYKSGSKVSGSLKVVTDKFLEYINSDELINGIDEMISKV